MNIVIANRQRTRKVNSRQFKRIVRASLGELGIESAELGIHLVGAKEMARINRQYLQHEGSTDVITFDHRPAGAAGAGIHGELFICVDDAVSQAKDFGATWQAEVVRYAVHGVLHLLGHDDLQPAARREMKRAENRAMRRLARAFSLAEIARSGNIVA